MLNFQSFDETDLEESAGFLSQEDCASKCDQDPFCISFDFCHLDVEELLGKQKCRLSSSSPPMSKVKLHNPSCSVFVHKQRQPSTVAPVLEKLEVAVVAVTKKKGQSLGKVWKKIMFSVLSLSLGYVIGRLVAYKLKPLLIDWAK